MHTLAKNTHHNKRLIEFCLHKAYPDGKITVEKLIEDNLVNSTQVAELAISRTSGIPLDEIGYGQDLKDGSDVKTATIYSRIKKQWFYKNNQRTDQYKEITDHRAVIRDLNSKIGNLRVILYNPFFEKWYYLIIPVNCYKNNLELRTCIYSGKLLGRVREFEVDSWEKLCSPCQFEIHKINSYGTN